MENTIADIERGKHSNWKKNSYRKQHSKEEFLKNCQFFSTNFKVFAYFKINQISINCVQAKTMK